jgi:predicted TIM-barrel fold metal-dependent hydrolase
MIDGQFVIDMQHHYVPADALKLVGKTPEYDFATSLKRFSRTYRTIADIDADLAYMDAAGIDMGILSAGYFVSNGLEFCRACNSGYARVIRQHPQRFRGMIHVNPYDDERLNRDEIKRSVEELGLFGLALVSSYGEMTLDAKELDPLYETAVAYDMPVYIHPTIRTGLWGGTRYDMHTTISREYDILKSFVEVLHGVLPRFAELKVIVAHFGGGFSTLKARLLAWHQPEDIAVPEDSRRHGLSIHEAQQYGLVEDFEKRCRNVLFDSAGMGGWLPVIRSSFETLGSEHICFGTDYPYELGKAPYVRKVLEDISGLPLGEDQKRRFFAGNLKRFFRVGKDDPSPATKAAVQE